jgi:hypothetical protein
MNQQTTMLVLFIALGAVLVAATQVPIITANAQNMTTTTGSGAAQNQTEMTSSTATTFTAQKTGTSTVDALPGHE